VTGATTLSSTLGVTGITTMSSNATVAGTFAVTGSTSVAAITSSGVCTASSFNATSDYRIKEVLRDLDNTFTIDNIRPVEYIIKKNNEKCLGVIAHELQDFFPYLVTGVKDGEELQTVNYIGLIPILINEIKNLKKGVKVLKAELENLQNSI
jgi:hypothetical protein